jgi:hypothetical protein
VLRTLEARKKEVDRNLLCSCADAASTSHVDRGCSWDRKEDGRDRTSEEEDGGEREVRAEERKRETK